MVAAPDAKLSNLSIFDLDILNVLIRYYQSRAVQNFRHLLYQINEKIIVIDRLWEDQKGRHLAKEHLVDLL